jgi:hypothetical protein
MRWFRGDRSTGTGPGRQGERFNRLLVYLFPIKSQDDRISRPNTPARSNSDSRPQPRSGAQRRPHTAPAQMHIPHPHLTHSSTNSELPLDIILHDSPIVILRGTGVDIETAILRGTVRLSLPEDTDIKVVEIRCTGKSRVVVMLKES